ncbi:TPR-like protein [Dioscorea alata]|uniref:TPR-like protein n=1 Tax=Dioscorea alata TaxID=55571 RepID=A0ACB7V0C6_DIOAL|nr:TPR-like protein [Dioscorea alata]
MERMPSRALRLALAAVRRLSTASSLASAPESAPAVVKKDLRPLYRRLSALGGAPDGSVAKVLNKWVREGKTVTSPELIKQVKELRKYGKYGSAIEVVDWMVKTKGMNLSITNHAIYLDLVSKVKGIESAELYFSSLPEAGKKQQTYGALLNCYCNEKLPEKAIPLYEKMKKLGLASNNLVQNNMMAFYMKLGQPEKAQRQFEEMKSENIAPDNFSYCILMNSYASKGDIDSVEEVVQDMEEASDITLTWSAYSTLAGIYNAAGLFEKAEAALKKLEQLIDSRDREPYHFLMTLYASTGNLAEVNRVWKSLKTTFPKLTNMSYLIILQALNKLDDLDGMERCFKEWESVHVAYDARLMNLMIGAYLRKDMIKDAESLEAGASLRVSQFDFKTAELFIDYHLKKQEMGPALKWLKEASSHVKPDKWKLNGDHVKMFLKNYEEAKDVKGAEEFCAILKQFKRLDSRAYDALIRTYAAAGKKEPSLQQRIKEDQIILSSKTKKMLDRISKA